jgi:hypothetical protein
LAPVFFCRRQSLQKNVKTKEGNFGLFFNERLSMFFLGTQHNQSIIIGVTTRVARWYIFKPKSPFWVNLRAFCNELCCFLTNGIFYGLLEYFMTIWYILWQCGIFCGNLVYFSAFWYVLPRKIWQHWSRPAEKTSLVRFVQILKIVFISKAAFLACFQGDQMSLWKNRRKFLN